MDDGFEFNFSLEKWHPDDITDETLLADDSGLPLATLRMYLEHVSPFRLEEFSKNAFINASIESLYLELE